MPGGSGGSDRGSSTLGGAYSYSESLSENRTPFTGSSSVSGSMTNPPSVLGDEEFDDELGALVTPYAVMPGSGRSVINSASSCTDNGGGGSPGMSPESAKSKHAGGIMCLFYKNLEKRKHIPQTNPNSIDFSFKAVHT